MNAKKVKRLRRFIKNLNPKENIYKTIEHHKAVSVREVNVNGVSSIVNKPIVKIQIILGDCQRKYYKNWKKINEKT